MKKMWMKLSLVLLMICLFMVPISTSATEIMPRWDNINRLDVDIGFDGSNGYISGVATKQSGVVFCHFAKVIYSSRFLF